MNLILEQYLNVVLIGKFIEQRLLQLYKTDPK